MTLNLFAFFHLNLMFSSIDEERRPEIIQKAYWPLLHLPHRIGAPIGIEATGLTLEIIQSIDPEWIDTLRKRIRNGDIELIGSGYAQIIGPLAPTAVNAKNLALGSQVYRDLLGQMPKLALVNEQAYAGGMIPLYKDEGYEALLMDWDNLAPFHLDWPTETRFRPRRAAGPDGTAIGLLWTQTLTFQRLQRYAHGEIGVDEYVEAILNFRGTSPRTLCIYSNDAEVFDVRPKRLHTEEDVQGDSEWERIGEAWARLSRTSGVKFIAPSQALSNLNPDATPLRLQTTAHPIPVKKQPKYNVTRWAVSGRDNLTVNATCERVTQRLLDDAAATDTQWRQLCRLWSSDFRTHIGDKRWTAFRHELQSLERQFDCPAPDAPTPTSGAKPLSNDRCIEVQTPTLRATLNRRRGLAIQSLSRSDDPRPPMLINLMHGHFQDIALQADWYTGNAVFEALDGPKVTDLEWANAATWIAPSSGDTIIETTIPTRKGPIFKRLAFSASQARVTIDMVFHWPDLGRGSLRAAHVLLNPEAFHWPDLTFETRNGGPSPDRFVIGDRNFDHGSSVSFQVSATTGLGVTDGCLKISDGRRSFSIEIDRTVAPMIAMVQNQMTSDGPFCRIMLSALELDDTRRPEPGPAAPRHIRYSLILE